MEHLISSIMVQGTSVAPENWDCLCSLWNWVFWVAVFFGVIGAAVSFLTRSVD
jgi:hypothetical protein